MSARVPVCAWVSACVWWEVSGEQITAFDNLELFLKMHISFHDLVHTETSLALEGWIHCPLLAMGLWSSHILLLLSISLSQSVQSDSWQK